MFEDDGLLTPCHSDMEGTEGVNCISHYKLYTEVNKDLEEIHNESYVVSIYYHIFSQWSNEHLWVFIKITGKNITVMISEVVINLSLEY